jgi:hypothetical protein
MSNNRRGGTRKQARGKAGGQRTKVIVREIVQKIERPVTPPPKDLVEARKGISDVVRVSATSIVAALIEKAEKGEVAPAKYLFEMVGLYPATAETSSKPEDSLAYTLLQRMGLEPEPGEETHSDGAN